MSLTFKDFTEMNRARANHWHGSLDNWSTSDWGVAAGGEMGECLDAIKKMNRVRDNLQGKKATARDVAEEAADTVMYLDLLVASLGLNLEDFLIEKFNQVTFRENLPRRFTLP